MMREQIMRMIYENKRTVKEISDALGLSKQEVLAHLAGLPVQEIRSVSHVGRGSPVVFTHYAVK